LLEARIEKFYALFWGGMLFMPGIRPMANT